MVSFVVSLIFLWKIHPHIHPPTWCKLTIQKSQKLKNTFTAFPPCYLPLPVWRVTDLQPVLAALVDLKTAIREENVELEIFKNKSFVYTWIRRRGNAVCDLTLVLMSFRSKRFELIPCVLGGSRDADLIYSWQLKNKCQEDKKIYLRNSNMKAAGEAWRPNGQSEGYRKMLSQTKWTRRNGEWNNVRVASTLVLCSLIPTKLDAIHATLARLRDADKLKRRTHLYCPVRLKNVTNISARKEWNLFATKETRVGGETLKAWYMKKGRIRGWRYKTTINPTSSAIRNDKRSTMLHIEEVGK